jgi:hypothetical protein
MNKIRLQMLFFLLILGLIAYASGQKTKIADDVRIIQNGKKPNPPKGIPSKVSFALEDIIGESDDPEKSFSQLSSFVVDDEGTVFALDFKDQKIKIYDNEGHFLHSFGDKGQGPAELQMASGIHLTPGDELVVEDALAKKLVYFTKEGKYIRNISFADRLAMVNLLMDPQGNYLGRDLKVEGQKMFFEIKKFDSGLKPLFSLDQIEFPIPIPGSGNKIDLMDVLSIYQFDSSSNIYYGRNKDYEIKVFSPEGKHLKTVRKEYDRQKVTEEDIEEILDRMGSIPNMGGINMKEMFEFPETFPPFQSFILDEEGRIIVRTFQKGKDKEEFIYDVFNPLGSYVTSFPSKMNISIIKNGRVYSIEENEEGFLSIHKYKVRWEL